MRLLFLLLSFVFPRSKIIYSYINQYIHKLFAFRLQQTSSRFECIGHVMGQVNRSKHLTLCGGNSESRAIIIGDIHGCFDEMKELLDKCGHDERTDTIIFVGDLVNKGPKSAETVKFVRALSEKGLAYCVVGNHDLAALKVYEGPKAGWKQKYNYLKSLTIDDVDWLRSLPFTIKLAPTHFEDALVVHAGLVPGVSLEQQSAHDMTCMRNLVAVAAAGSGGPSYRAIEGTSEGEAWAGIWQGPYKVYFGHDAKRGLQLNWPMAVGLDTGCCYGKHLTACILPGNKIVQVKAHAEYAPKSHNS